jgi:hypothetical protein
MSGGGGCVLFCHSCREQSRVDTDIRVGVDVSDHPPLCPRCRSDAVELVDSVDSVDSTGSDGRDASVRGTGSASGPYPSTLLGIRILSGSLPPVSIAMDGFIDGLVGELVHGNDARMREDAPLAKEIRDGLMEVVVRRLVEDGYDSEGERGDGGGNGGGQHCAGNNKEGGRASSEPRGEEAFTVEGTECSVCQTAFEAGERVVELACCHGFHRECLMPWLERGGRTCPVCRMRIQ